MEVIDLLIIGVVVAVFWRLFRTLGRQTGFFQRPGDVDHVQGVNESENRASADNVISLSGKHQKDRAPSAEQRAHAKPGDPLGQTLTEIAQLDRDFEVDEFLEGARMAYDMIITSFARGDRDALAPLLDDDVFESFTKVISAREEADHHTETRIVGEVDADIVDARLEGKDAYLTIRFQSDLISFTRDHEDVLIEGDPERAREVKDVWTFMRSMKSRDPNWLLVATESSETDSAQAEGV